MNLHIDVVSDVACPWCYIGLRHLETALDNLGLEAELTFHPFQLDPAVPPQGRDFVAHMDKKFGASVWKIFERVEQAAANAGLSFDFAAMPRAINTLPLHRILHIAHAKGNQPAVKEALLQAYFVKRLDLTDSQTLAAVLEPYGWSYDETFALLGSDIGRAEVEEEMQYFREMGVSSVPFFIFNNRYALSGAQPVGVFMNQIQQVLQQENENTYSQPDGV